ncbi:hypothetical protein KFE25_001916 [Diacronema lutheri]|mgnify:CR=1 FL=1|uniref:Steroid 5-alpha reductase C-terminal domain-containing protein n=1 Tax=Diacronema lutheri TaxID=2081491 RepID=A0A8J6CDS0_DIALT|nr:hypothetical protein KFE25_001916 [Diacronema lutheri]
MWVRRLLTVNALLNSTRACAFGSHARATPFPSTLRPWLASARIGARASAPVHDYVRHLRGGSTLGAGVGARRASTGAPVPHEGVSMFAGAAISAAVIYGLNGLGCAVSVADPSLGEKVADLLGTGAIALSAIVSNVISPASMNIRVVLATVAVVMWGTRLASFLFVRALNRGGDGRLTGYFTTFPKAFLFWITSATWGWLTALPQTLLCFSTTAAVTPLGPFGAFAAGLVFLGIWTEAVADWQKWQFKSDPANKDKWCDVGLWAKCRHPNYASELVIWTSLFALAAHGLDCVLAVAAAAHGPLFVAGLILFGSGVPLAEKIADRRYGHLEAFQVYKRETPLLVPRIFPLSPEPPRA